MRTNLFPVAQEGWKYLGYCVLFFMIFFILDFDFLAFMAFFSFVSVVYFFRNPERRLSHYEEGSIVSPVDGIVKQVVTLDDNSPYDYKIEIESSCGSVGILRVPFTSKVQSIKHYCGTRVSKNSKLFSDLNERAIVVFSDKDANTIKVEHTLKQSFAPLSTSIIEGQTLQQTLRYGFMFNGILSVYLPRNVRVNVKTGNRVIASETLLGYLS